MGGPPGVSASGEFRRTSETRKGYSITDTRTLDLTPLREAASSARYEARKALQAYVKAPDDEKAASAFDAAERNAEATSRRYERAQQLSGTVERVGGELPTYRVGGPHSWLMDQAASARGDFAASERIVRNFREQLDSGQIDRAEFRALSDTLGSGGELVAPTYLQNLWTEVARVGRPYIAHLHHLPLPDHTQKVSVPALTTGTSATAASDNAAPSETEAATALQTAEVITASGKEKMARQLFERADPQLMDMALFPDLCAAYVSQMDVESLEGSGASPHARGVLNTANINKIVAGTESIEEIYKAIAKGLLNTWAERKLPPDLLILHPRRWAWWAEQMDERKRPMILPRPYPTEEVGGAPHMPCVPVADFIGMKIVLDGNVTTTKATNQDVAVLQRGYDSWFLEDPLIRTKVNYDYSGSEDGEVLTEVYGYAAVMHNRYPKALNLIEGAALKAPTL